MRALKISVAVAMTIALVAVVASAVPRSEPSGPPPPAPSGASHDAAHEPPATVRTLAVHTGAEPKPTADPRRMRGLLLAGRLPTRAVKAKVLTDEDCAADANGVSHCRNQLRLPSGRTVTIRHPHRMHDVPCMTPGEMVRLRPAATT